MRNSCALYIPVQKLTTESINPVLCTHTISWCHTVTNSLSHIPYNFQCPYVVKNIVYHSSQEQIVTQEFTWS